MRLASFLIVAVPAFAHGLTAQGPPRPEPVEPQHWTFSVGSGSVPVSGAGARLLASGADGSSTALRRRLGESRWWIGFELDSWHAAPTAAGMESLVARSGIPGIDTRNGGGFYANGMALSTQYDAWRSDRLVGYILASVGTNRSGGHIHRWCTHFLEPCESPGADIEAPGTNAAAMAGLGLRLRLFDAGGWWRAIPQRLHAEARIANQGTADGRVMTTPFLLGFSW